MRAKFSLTDQEIVRRREEGATIIKLAEESGVSYGTMCRKLESLQSPKDESGGIRLYDTLGDGKGGFWTVVGITDKQLVIKNREIGRTDVINKQLIASGKTAYHKLDTPPVRVYNLKDQEPETPKEQRTDCENRGYLLRIDKILSAAKGINKDAIEYLYDLVQQILLNGFDNEFGEKKRRQ